MEKRSCKKQRSKKKLYETIVEVGELKADQIQLNLNLKPETDLVEEIVKTKTENSVLLKFKRFKRWVSENIVGLSAVTISIAGIITAAVMSGKSAVKKVAGL